MKPFIAIFSLLSALSLSAFASEFKIDLKINGEHQATVDLAIEGDMATSKVFGETEEFNLKDQSWFHPKTSKWITFDQSKALAELSKAQYLKSAETAPENLRPFALWLVNPTFEIKKDGDKLSLISGHVDYVIEGRVSQTDVEKYFRYAVLNAYKKGIVERRLPPFSELKAVEEMSKLGYIPKKMTITMPSVPKMPKIEMEITETKP